jgi:hypothetical protein
LTTERLQVEADPVKHQTFSLTESRQIGKDATHDFLWLTYVFSLYLLVRLLF